MPQSGFRIGVISDTHGLLRDAGLRALKGSQLIIHAGDMGGDYIVPELRRIAPVVAVRGNVDRGEWAAEFREREVIELSKLAGAQESLGTDTDELRIYVLHNLRELDLRPEAAGFAVVVYGHSHEPEIHYERGVLYFNPGSAGPRRFSLPVSVGRLTVRGGEAKAELISIED